MGKSRKGRQYVNKSNYPYRTSHVGQHVHVVRPRARRQGNSQQPYFIGQHLALLCGIPTGNT